MVATQIFFDLHPKNWGRLSPILTSIFFKGGDTQPPTSRYFLCSPLPEEMIQFDKYFPVTHVFSAIKKGFLYSLARFCWAIPPDLGPSQEAPLQPQVASRFGSCIHRGVVGTGGFLSYGNTEGRSRVSLNGDVTYKKPSPFNHIFRGRWDFESMIVFNA